MIPPPARCCKQIMTLGADSSGLLGDRASPAPASVRDVTAAASDSSQPRLPRTSGLLSVGALWCGRAARAVRGPVATLTGWEPVAGAPTPSRAAPDVGPQRMIQRRRPRSGWACSRVFGDPGRVYRISSVFRSVKYFGLTVTSRSRPSGRGILIVSGRSGS